MIDISMVIGMSVLSPLLIHIYMYKRYLSRVENGQCSDSSDGTFDLNSGLNRCLKCLNSESLNVERFKQ